MKRVVVLDKIRSLYNVGSIIRTSDAFGIGEVILCDYTPTPQDERLWKRQLGDPDAMISKTALKGLQSVTWGQEETATKALKRLKDEGFYCVAIEQHPTATALSTLAHVNRVEPRDVAIVIGNELDGVSPEALELCDQILEIPMQGKGKSLNVAVAFGIAAYTLLN